jgi:Fe-S-cluster-containing hydrogenase component 2
MQWVGDLMEVPKSGIIVHNPNLCRGCRICELACSAYHEGICSPYLSRIHIASEDLKLIFPARVCAQCKCPSCYLACPLKDEALCIDSETGARYINQNQCIGCGQCAKACPLPNQPIWQKKVGDNLVSFKCDLCRGRKGGAICVEICPRNALTFEEGG